MVDFVLKILRKLTKISPKVIEYFLTQKIRNDLKLCINNFSIFFDNEDTTSLLTPGSRCRHNPSAPKMPPKAGPLQNCNSVK